MLWFYKLGLRAPANVYFYIRNGGEKLTKYKLIIFQALLLVIFISSHARADELILKNGDKLTGNIIKIEDSILTLETRYSEPIKINYDSVLQMNSTNPVEIHLKDGEILKGRITTDNTGGAFVDAGSGREGVVIKLDSVVALNPPPKKPVAWKGNITLGGNLQTGNSETMNISAGASATRRTVNDRFSLNFLYNRTEDDGEKTAENRYGQLKYDYFLNPVWYLYLNIDMLSDEFEDINLRTTVGPGIGYQIWEEENKALSLEAGVSYTSEDRDQAEDSDWLSARVGANYMYKLFERVLFTDQFVIYPDLEETGEYLLRNETALVTDINSRLAFKLSNIWERNSTPEQGLDKDDLTWILGLQYSFK